MDLDTQPLHLEVEFLLQLFDKSLADVAERSYIVGKDPNVYAHTAPFPRDGATIAAHMIPLPLLFRVRNGNWHKTEHGPRES
ncbi:MAG TPA: hypothetical protein DCO77_06615 [Nitrospiraceae bacterium]|nr:hypothetical protein [Nitrospiraceae bacterium]